MTKQVSIERIEKIPASNWDLPSDELYVRLGCSVCPRAICFKALGVTSLSSRSVFNKEEAEMLGDLTDDIEKKTTVHRGSTDSYDDPCPNPCPQAEDVEVSIDLINVCLDAELTLPQL
jgi:hypothetical protein